MYDSNDVDDIVLTLTNEGDFYYKILPYIKRYLGTDYPLTELEADIRQAAKHQGGVRMYDATGTKLPISVDVTKALIEHYREEIEGTSKPKPEHGGFKVGDEVRKKDGTKIGGALESAMIDWIDDDGDARFDSTQKGYSSNYWSTMRKLELVNLCSEVKLIGNHATSIITVELNEDTIMSHKLIETKTFIRGQEAANVDDDAIYSHIAAVEAEMSSYDKIDNKPKSLTAKIVAMGKEVAELVAYVDNRNSL